MAVTLAAVLTLASTDLARADEPASVAKAKNYQGTVIELNEANHTLTVRGLVTTRTFSASGNCKIAMEDKADAAWSDLAIGQKVELRYHKAQGVNVASQVFQRNLILTGYLTALDPAKRSLSVKHGCFTRSFTLAQDSSVQVNNGKSGSLSDLKIGDTIGVVYHSENDPLTAQRLEQRSLMAVGTLQAIDLDKQSVTLKSFAQERQFQLGADCKIVVNDKLGATLSDLRVGDRVSVAYRDAGGVWVANRLGRESAAQTSVENAAASEFFP